MHRGAPLDRAAVRLGCALVVLTALMACSPDAMLRRLAPPVVDRYARDYVRTLATASPDVAAAQFTPRLAELPGVMDSLRSLQSRFAPVAPIDSMEIVGAGVFESGGAARRTLTYQVHGAGGWAVAQLTILDAGGQRWVDAVHVDRLTQSLEETNAFMRHLGAAQIIMLVWALGVVVFCLGTAVVVARTAMPHRWWWAFAALIGVGTFGMDWTSASTFTHAITFQILSASFGRLGTAGPWMITCSFPIGAVAALARRDTARRARDQAAARDASCTTAPF